jgi:transmembrane sensor
MKHDPYSLTELIRNEEFIAWVMHPDELSDRKWQAFLEKHPRKRKTVESAREYVILLAKDTGRHQPTRKQSDRMWSIVESHMHDEVTKTPEPVPVFKTSRGHGWRWARVAASAALILSIGSVSYWFYYKKADGPLQEVAVREEADLPNTIQKYNDTDKPMTVLLQDGSSVVLQPGGRLSYSEGSNRKRREVTLTGEGVF